MMKAIYQFVFKILESILAVLIAANILFCAIWQGILYPFGLASKPSGRRMISSFVGEAQFNKRWWGNMLGPVIDKLFELIGTGPNHCINSYLRYGHLDD